MIATIEATSTDYSSYFSDGDGSESDPFVIGSADEFMNISYLSNAMITNYYYFKLSTDIELSGSGYICTYFQGQITGYKNKLKNYSITSSSSSIWLSAYTVGKADFLNFEIVENGGFLGLVAYSGAYITGATDSDGEYIYDNYISFSGITVDGEYTVSTNAAPLTAITYGTTTFDTCINLADINITGYAGIFLGGYPIYAKVSYINCQNGGDVYGVCVGFFNGNSFNNYSSFILSSKSDFSDISETDLATYSVAYVSGCVNYTEICGTTSCSPFATNNGTSYNADANEQVVSNRLFYRR